MTEQIEGNVEVPPVGVEVANKAVEQVDTGAANIQDSFVGTVRAGGDAKVENSLASAIVAGGNIQIETSISSAIVAGGNIAMQASNGIVMVAGGNVDMREGCSGLINCSQATVENSRIGVLLSGQVTLGDNVSVLMTQKQAIAFGAAFGAAFGLAAVLSGLLFRRRR